MGFFQDVFGNGGAKDAAAAKIAGLNAGYGQASDLYGQGRNAITTNYAAALDPYSQVFNEAGGGGQAYGDLTGANGQQGFDRAVQLFRNSPGYQFALDQGIQAAERVGSKYGQNNSGNEMTALDKFGTGLADQTYGNYVQRLQPYLQQRLAGAAGIAGVNMGQGNALNTSF